MKKHLITPLIGLLVLAGCQKEDFTPNDRQVVPPNQPTEPTGIRYNSLVFEDITITRNVLYGQNRTQDGIQLPLRMDVYEPATDPEPNRPLIVLAHGGSFLGGDKAEMSDLALFFAQSGYVVASINYRLLDIPLTEDNIKMAVMDAVHDMRAAIRFFGKDRQGSNLYRTDGRKVFVGGFSAGAFMSLHLAYVNDTEELVAMGGHLANHVMDNGGLEGNSGNPGFSSQVTGVINLAGALYKADFVNQGEPPLFSQHGTWDGVVPIDRGVSDDTGVITEGSNLIHARAQAVGVRNELLVIEMGEHAPFDDCTSCRQSMRAFIFGLL